jgi:predicted membrane chloride channel (bestrophin family)
MMPPKPRVVLANAFSLSMLSATETTLRVREITADEVKKLLSSSEFESAVGHEDTARLLTKLLGVEVRAERKQVTIDANTILVVFQLLSRLPEGRVLTEEELTKIPYKFFVVEVC